jgi:hypothetical protein
MKAYVGVEVWLHSFFTSVLDGREWSTSSPSCFSSVKEPQCPLNRRLGEPQSQFRHFEEWKNLLLLPGFKPCISQAVAQSLYRLITTI